MKLYHGTSDSIEIDDILYPSSITSVLRESRCKNKDIVFLTKSLVSAEMYANKACINFGGKPIVFEVDPIGYYDDFYNMEVICNEAKILRRIEC